MNKFEITHYNSYDRGRTFINKNILVLTPLAQFPAVKTKFDSDMATFETAILKQAVAIGMDAANKVIIKNILGTTVIKHVHRGWIQALLLGETKMAMSLNFPLSYITTASDKLAESRATDLKAFLDANKGTLTEIKAANITEMEDVIAKYSAALTLPETDIKERKTEGTDVIAQSIVTLEQDKLMISRLIRAELPSLAAGWDNETRIGQPKGMRHTSIRVHYTDADTGVPLKGVVTTVSNGDKSFVCKSTSRGWSRFYSLDSDNWTMTSEQKTFETDTKTNIGVDDEHKATFEIKLQKKSVIVDGGGSTPAPTGYGNGYGTMYNSVNLEPIANGLVFLDKVADPIETDDDGSWGNDHIPADCKTIRGTADGYANYFKNISITPDDDNEIDLPMDPVDDGPTPPDA